MNLANTTRKQALFVGEKWYFTGKPCKNGHIERRQSSNGACAACASDRGKAFYHHPDRLQVHRDAAKAKMRDRLSDPMARAVFNQRRRADRADPIKGQKLRDADNARRMRFPDQQIAKQRRQNAKRRSDPIKRFALNASSLIRLTLLNGRWKKPAKTEAILGCSMNDFRVMIERQFQPGMSWSNIGKWHLDHIVPISSAKTQEEAESLSKAGNFRPLWAKDNLVKSNSVVFLL
jgi:hypothetical protein